MKSMTKTGEVVVSGTAKVSVPSRGVCVFGSASEEIDSRYPAYVEELGRRMGEAGLSLVFGGGALGLMGAVARGVDAAGGIITGITPEVIDEVQLRYPHMRFVLTPDVDERKHLMVELSRAFVVVPGGIGTLDELFYVCARNIIGEIRKPVLVLNVDGFFDDLLTFLDRLEGEGFIDANYEGRLEVYPDPASLTARLAELVN